MFDDGVGTVTRRPGVWKPLTEEIALKSAMDSLAFAVGEPETYVQAPKAKGLRNRTLFGFPTPRSRVYRAVCGGVPQTFLACMSWMASVDLGTDTGKTRSIRKTCRIPGFYPRERHPLPVRSYADGCEA